jgi:hypothetical protein
MQEKQAMKLLKPMLAAWVLGATLMAGNVQAATMTLSPAKANAGIGGTTDLELHILDLGDGSAPSLGFFKLDIGFDPTVVGFQAVTYSDLLGDVDLDTTTSTRIGTGTIQIDNISLLDAAMLDALQPADFLLATLRFQGLAAGVSAFTMTAVELGDADGGSLAVDAINNAEIRVAAVPSPAPFALFIPCLLLLRRSRFKNN